jgi:two-component system CheB/CheR fusion protein
VEREVEGLRDYMRAAIEEHGTVQEELRSAHEEMLSANEEFQSTNEELETSKEELQSTNEELTTTIDELRRRNQELAALNKELDAARLASDRARSFADIIIETVREPLAVLDGALRILRVNSAFSANLDILPEELEGRFLREVGGGRWNIPELHQRLGALLTNAKALEDWEVTVDLAQQGRRVMSLSARRIPGDADRTDLLLLALEDVTARAEMTAGLLANSERKDQFIAMLGHELRHPLTPITHAIYLLRQGHPDPATTELLTAIDTQTHRLLRFVNDLLDVARIGRGLIEIRPERLDFVAVAREAVQALQPFIEERQHVLSLVLPAAPMYVMGDSGRLSQVVSNLVENAAKYTEPCGRIAVTLEQRDDEAVLRVRDSGIGIAAENLERIFEPFTQSHGALASPSSGLGLGLSVVQRIMELHGGHVKATSGGLDMGSEFVASLPVLAADKGTTLVPEPGESLGSAREAAHPEGHDSRRSRRDQGVGRASGPQLGSRSRHRQGWPECPLTCGGLPTRVRYRGHLIAGDERDRLARRLRQRFPPAQLYLIALTGYAGADIREACLAAGFDVHLVKPGEVALLGTLLGRDRENSDATPHDRTRQLSEPH